MISNETCRSQYSGNDAATEFAYLFPLLDKSYIKVVLTAPDGTETTLTVDSDFTVNGVGSSDSADWNVVYPVSGSPLPSGYTITLLPDQPFTQLTNFSNQGGFYPETHTRVADYITVCLQQLKEITDRCVKAPSGSVGEFDFVEEIAAAQAAAASSEYYASVAEAAAAGATGSIPPWVVSTAYALGITVVASDNQIYKCAIAHTASSFSSDLAAGRWELLAPEPDVAAGTIMANLTASNNSPAANSLIAVRNALDKARVDIASASSVDIGAATSAYVRITGNTTITAFSAAAAGIVRRLYFAGSLTLTHNATSLILPSGANVITSAGDIAEFVSEGSGNWRCVGYAKANGEPLSSTSSGLPPGVYMPYAGLTAPDGWFLCYGQAVSRTTYAALFAVIGTRHGAGDGSTTFNVPDVRGRVVVGKDNMGGSAAGRITSAGCGIDGETQGATGGSETHQLTADQNGQHSHAIESKLGTTDSQAQHSGVAVATNNYWTTPVSGVAGSSGLGSAHNNVQPSVIDNYIIKA